MESKAHSHDQDPLEEVQQQPPIREVVIDGIAVLKIVKHCNESLPTMVAGSLLGLDSDGVMEITYSYPFPIPKSDNDGEPDEFDGSEYQIEMMKMLRDVNIDNNCVGWYQSMYMGTVCTGDVVTYQYGYQSSEELSENSVVLMYDPIQSKKGNLILKAFRLSRKFIEMKRSKSNDFISPSEILDELPLKIRNMGIISAYLRCLADTHSSETSCEFEGLSMANAESHAEKQLELVNAWLDDLVNEQQKFQQHARVNAKARQEHVRWLNKRIQDNIEARDDGGFELSLRIEDSGLKPLTEIPPRTENLLFLGQLDRYCGQLSEHVDKSVSTIQIANQVNSST